MAWWDQSPQTNGFGGHSYVSPAPAPGPARGILNRLRQTVGGWLGPRQSLHVPVVADELRNEKAASGPRGIGALPWFLPFFDNLTQETAAMRKAYRLMWNSPDVKAACAGKIYSVAALDLNFQPANKKSKRGRLHADFVDYVFNERIRGGMPRLAWDILFGACTDGYSVNEKVWGMGSHRWRDQWIYRALKPKDTGNDVILQTDEFRNVTGLLGLRYNAGQEMSPANFVIYNHMPMFDQPTGMSDFRAVYSTYWMLDTARKMRSIGLEKRAYPVVVGHWKNASDQPGLEGQLAKIKWQNWLSVPESVKAEVLDLAGQGFQAFTQAIKDLKHDVFLGIQFAVLQALEGTMTDARGNSQVHKSQSELVTWYLAATMANVFNDFEAGLIRDLIDVNFIADEYPKASISSIDLNELLLDLQIDSGLLQAGVPLSAEEVYERYNRTPPKTTADALRGSPVQQPAQPGSQPASPFSSGMGGPINALTAQPKKTFLMADAGGKETPARPFRFSEEWTAYLNGE